MSAPGRVLARRFAPALFALVIGAACRQRVSDELVYTGRTPPPPPADAAVPLPDAGEVDAGVIEGFTKTALLEAVADCTLDQYRGFQAAAADLQQKAEALALDRSSPNLAAARDAWRAAMARWEEAEMFSFGPAARATLPGGRGLRDQIYSWPLVNRCKIEEQIVDRSYTSPTFGTSLINGRGLGAFEYLVFYDGTDNACSQFSPINADGTWAALSADELALRKAEYAAAVAREVSARATELVEAWAPEGGNFRHELAAAGAGSTTFAMDHAALNAVSDALFYLDMELKDQKLARPLGLAECNDTVCPELLESRWAGASAAHIAANLIGFQRIFTGCGEGGAGLGFDDWLHAAGAPELAARMVSALAGARSTIAALDGPMEQILVSDAPRIMGVYDAIKAVNDPLKSELITVLDLELPMSVEGDND